MRLAKTPRSLISLLGQAVGSQSSKVLQAVREDYSACADDLNLRLANLWLFMETLCPKQNVCPKFRTITNIYQEQVLTADNRPILNLVMLNKLKCFAHFWFSANQIIWSRLLIPIHSLNDKQCRSRSVGFSRSQLIWIYTVYKGRVYPGSAGQGLRIGLVCRKGETGSWLSCKRWRKIHRVSSLVNPL